RPGTRPSVPSCGAGWRTGPALTARKVPGSCRFRGRPRVGTVSRAVPRRRGGPAGPVFGGGDMPPPEPVASRRRSAEPRQRSRPGWVLALTSVAYFMVVLDALVVITALPAIGGDLAAGMATLQWTVNAYSLTFAAGSIPGAALGGRLGRRRVFAVGLALFTAASAGCALAPSATLLVAARAVRGGGGAVGMPLRL